MLVRGRGQARVASLVAACFLVDGCHDKAAPLAGGSRGWHHRVGPPRHSRQREVGRSCRLIHAEECLYWQMLPRSTDPVLPAAAIPVQIA
jgi:hypothetical protein